MASRLPACRRHAGFSVMTECGRSSVTRATSPRQAAWENRACIQGRKPTMRRNDSASSSRLELVSNQPWIDDSTRPTAMDTIELASIDLSSNRELISPLNFSHEALYFPLGFPMRLLSNSPAIHAAAEQSWSYFQQTFAHVPLEMRLDLKDNMVGRSKIPPAPVHRV